MTGGHGAGRGISPILTSHRSHGTLFSKTQTSNIMKKKYSLKQTLSAVAVSAGLLGFACDAAEEVPIWLSSLNLSAMSSGWGQPHADKSVQDKPLSIGGKIFEKGVGTHASSKMRLKLDGKALRFSAFVGVDDEINRANGTVRFRVLGDAKTLWDSGIMKAGAPAKPLDVDLKGVSMLVLMVDDAGDGVGFDHADWADAKFTMLGDARPEPQVPPVEKPYILTPKPSPKPRINGPKIFGARPGSPFLYTIPATGSRPMTFAVDKLPDGLTVDSTNGRITGVLKEKGEFTTLVKVSNSLGKTEREFKIVSGEMLALTPHMGWNSWYVWENHVTDKIMRDAADAMVNSGMIDHGYMYVNIDDCWAVKPGTQDASLSGELRDSQGRINSNKRFPDMNALTDYIHSKGLKAGLYTSPGRTTCAGHAGSYQFEEQDARRFAEWGFDFLKHDWCSYSDVAPSPKLDDFKRPYQLMGDILKKQKRDIVLNLCQYGMGDVWKWGREVGGHSWRTAGDLGGSFQGIAAALFRDGFDVYSQMELHKYGGPGGWNDPDYLLLGHISNWGGQTVPTPLTPNEQYTHVSLWCILAAPLIFSGDIARLDEFTLSLLTNDELLDVDQDSLGKPGKRIAKQDEIEVWSRDLEDGSKAVGLFNRGEIETNVIASWNTLGLQGKHAVRDLWRQIDLGSFDEKFSASVPPHGVVMIKVK
jgi:alpha-galactosidase